MTKEESILWRAKIRELMYVKKLPEIQYEIILNTFLGQRALLSIRREALVKNIKEIFNFKRYSR